MVLPRRLRQLANEARAAMDEPHPSPELVPPLHARAAVVLTGRAILVPYRGPRWGREPVEISGQQRTATDNDAAGQPACRLVA
jgi:hypothetical protein